ncbi:MAG: hypothetical protein CMK06_01635 [Ponticaulis sp.]|nr:hypothetical protein [Ponticaulis sp.]
MKALAAFCLGVVFAAILFVLFEYYWNIDFAPDGPFEAWLRDSIRWSWLTMFWITLVLVVSTVVAFALVIRFLLPATSAGKDVLTDTGYLKDSLK